MYNIADFTDDELYNLLDLTDPSDGELEARIIQMLQRHMNVDTPNGQQLFQFFNDVYEHFFSTATTTTNAQEEDDFKKEEEEKKKEEEVKVEFTKEVAFAPGKINPLLKETYTRTISIDSQYREPEYPFSTDFTVNFNETLKDVVSMKLYAVQIPITWYTISNSYGSNFFLFMPQLVTDGSFNTLGIYDNPNHQYKLEIEPGNYGAADLVTEINKGLTTLNTIYTDVSFGNTKIEYNANNAKATFTFDIQKVYNEFSYDISYGTNTKKLLGIPADFNPISLTSVYQNVNDIPLYSTGPNKIPTQLSELSITNFTLSLYQYPEYVKSTPLTVLPSGFVDKIVIVFDFSKALSFTDWVESMNRTLSTYPRLINSSIRIVTIGSETYLEIIIKPNRSKTNTLVGGKWILERPANSSTVLSSFIPDRYTLLGSQPFYGDISSNVTYTISNETIVFHPIRDVLGGVYIDPVAYKNYSNNNDISVSITPGTYTVSSLITEINNLYENHPILHGSNISSGDGNYISKVVPYYNINKIYTTRDYSVVFYDVSTFSKCTNTSTSYTNATMDTTLGYILGFHVLQTYEFSESKKISNNMGRICFQNPNTLLSTGSDYTYTDEADDGNNVNHTIVTLRGDTVVNIYLYTYFMIILDDFNQNHLNDGLVTLSKRDYSVTLPSYANRKMVRQCNPLTNSVTPSSLLVNNNNNNNFNNLTQNQLYSVGQILAQQDKQNDNYNRGVFVKDMFALLPVKTTGMTAGSILVEAGGQLQLQERIYFGPVNIRRIAVKLVNDKGDIVDLNGGNWSFQLVCVQLYQKGG
jgi:hypothetical protein